MITIRTLRQYLDSAEMMYCCDASRAMLFVPFPNATVRLRVVDDGEAMLLWVPELLSLDEATRHREALLRTMVALNGRLKIGTFGADPEDGEVSVAHFVAVEDGELTEAQFRRTLRGICYAAQRFGRLLRHVAYRGDGGLALDALIEQVERTHRRYREARAKGDPRLAEPPEALRELFEKLAAEDDPKPPDTSAGDTPAGPEGDDHE